MIIKSIFIENALCLLLCDCASRTSFADFQEGYSMTPAMTGDAYKVSMVRSTLVHFGVRGAENDVLTDFTKLVVFMTKLIQDKKLYALHRESSKVQCFI